MNWEKETFRIQTGMMDMMRIPHWAKAEQLDRVMPLNEICNLEEHVAKDKSHHLETLSIQIRLAIAKCLYRIADGICPVVGKMTTTV